MRTLITIIAVLVSTSLTAAMAFRTLWVAVSAADFLANMRPRLASPVNRGD